MNQAMTPLVIFGVSHLVVPVKDLRRALALYEGVLGFSPKEEGEGFVDLDTGAVLVRLAELPHESPRATLRVHVNDVPRAFEATLAGGASPLYAPARDATREAFATVRDADGNTLQLFRPLTEDEYEAPPALPTEGTWLPEAEALLKSLLMAVPALFRALARRKIVRLAEELARPRAVTERDVVRAYILSSARVTRYRLRAPLAAHGYDPDDFREEFESD